MSVTVKLAQRLLDKSYVSEFIEAGAHKDISPQDYLFEIGMAETVATEYAKEFDAIKKGIESLESEIMAYEEKSEALAEKYRHLGRRIEDGISSRLNNPNITPDYYLSWSKEEQAIKAEMKKIQKTARVYESESGEIRKYIAEKIEKEFKPMSGLHQAITSYRETLIESASAAHSWETYESYLTQKRPVIESAQEGGLDIGQYGTEILGASMLSGKFGVPQAISQELRSDSLEYLTQMEGILEYSEFVANMKSKDGVPLWKIRIENEMKRINQEFSEFMQYLQAKKSGK